MDRRRFLGASAAGGIELGGAAAQNSNLPAKFAPSAHTAPRSPYGAALTPDYYTFADNLVIERNQPGKPHQGKVLAAIQAHSDDITLFAAGTVAKLIDEGYTGYLVRVRLFDVRSRRQVFGTEYSGSSNATSTRSRVPA